MAEKRVNTFGTFLKTIQSSSSEAQQQRRGATSSTSVETLLDIVRNEAGGIETAALLQRTGMNVVEFGQLIERLQKLEAIRLDTAAGGEIVKIGPKADEVLSILTQ